MVVKYIHYKELIYIYIYIYIYIPYVPEKSSLEMGSLDVDQAKWVEESIRFWHQHVSKREPISSLEVGSLYLHVDA